MTGGEKGGPAEIILKFQRNEIRNNFRSKIRFSIFTRIFGVFSPSPPTKFGQIPFFISKACPRMIWYHKLCGGNILHRNWKHWHTRTAHAHRTSHTVQITRFATFTHKIIHPLHAPVDYNQNAYATCLQRISTTLHECERCIILSSSYPAYHSDDYRIVWIWLC